MAHISLAHYIYQKTFQPRLEKAFLAFFYAFINQVKAHITLFLPRRISRVRALGVYFCVRITNKQIKEIQTAASLRTPKWERAKIGKTQRSTIPVYKVACCSCWYIFVANRVQFTLAAAGARSPVCFLLCVYIGECTRLISYAGADRRSEINMKCLGIGVYSMFIFFERAPWQTDRRTLLCRCILLRAIWCQSISNLFPPPVRFLAAAWLKQWNYLQDRIRDCRAFSSETTQQSFVNITFVKMT